MKRLTSRRGGPGLVLVIALATVGLAGCGSDEKKQDADKDAGHEFSAAADRNICKADAKPLGSPYGDGFPQEFPFPPQTTVYDYEDRGDTGAIVTGITSAPFKDVLDHLNHAAVDAGFAITEGETEEHDAEANWTSQEYRGRWAIRESATCPGETVVQVLAAPAS